MLACHFWWIPLVVRCCFWQGVFFFCIFCDFDGFNSVWPAFFSGCPFLYHAVQFCDTLLMPSSQVLQALCSILHFDGRHLTPPWRRHGKDKGAPYGYSTLPTIRYSPCRTVLVPQYPESHLLMSAPPLSAQSPVAWFGSQPVEQPRRTSANAAYNLWDDYSDEQNIQATTSDPSGSYETLLAAPVTSPATSHACTSWNTSWTWRKGWTHGEASTPEI